MQKDLVDFTDDEIEQRLSVWTALSDIFVDVEQSPEEYERHLDYIAQNLVNTSFSIQEMESILREELGPIFVCNFSIWNSIAETEGWEKEDIASIMKDNRAKKNTLDGLFRKIFKKDPFKNKTVARRWEGIKRRLKTQGEKA